MESIASMTPEFALCAVKDSVSSEEDFSKMGKSCAQFFAWVKAAVNPTSPPQDLEGLLDTLQKDFEGLSLR
jgi:hypothetical protein